MMRHPQSLQQRHQAQVCTDCSASCSCCTAHKHLQMNTSRNVEITDDTAGHPNVLNTQQVAKVLLVKLRTDARAMC